MPSGLKELTTSQSRKEEIGESRANLFVFCGGGRVINKRDAIASSEEIHLNRQRII